jgi:hypothetical protein
MMTSKRLLFPLAILVLALLPLAVSAQADPSEYGIKSASVGVTTTQAGAHPDFNVSFELNTEASGLLPATTQTITTELPPGLLANPTAVPQCTMAQLVGTEVENPANTTGCPQASQVGIATVKLFNSAGIHTVGEPIFNMVPGPGEPARFGLFAEVYPVVIDAQLRSSGPQPYGATATIDGIATLIPLLSSDATFWGVPADESHDEERLTAYEAAHSGSPETPDHKRSSGLPLSPFTRNPTLCAAAQTVRFTAAAYALPGQIPSEALAPLSPNTGCGQLDFSPSLALHPTSSQAKSASGLEGELALPQSGLEFLNVPAEADMRKAVIALPEGVTANPSLAEGMAACTEAQLEAETASSAPGEGCPQAAKVGTLEVETPALAKTLDGFLYLAKPYGNPFGSLLAMYLVIKDAELGIIVRQPVKVEIDPATGQLTTVAEDLPQLPFSDLRLRLREGARSPLVTPPHCGTYSASATFTSWSGKIASAQPSFQITQGPGGGPCPVGPAAFAPDFLAGTINNAAGSFSTFYARLSRSDADQEISRFSIQLPPGLVAKLAGVPYCPDQAIEAARARTGPEGGREELESPSCPAASQIGRILAGAGVGSALSYASGKVYLAGPYHGSKLSIVAITAGVVGPFDVGTVVVRQGLKVDPESAVASINAAGSDPIPHVIKGIPVQLRDVRAYVDRPQFTLNPTDCAPTATTATLFGAGLDFASETDDSAAALTSPFQAADCAALPFKPRLGLKLIGGTKRGAHPAFKAHLEMSGIGESGIASAQVTLPRSEFIENAHFKTICTRVQFKAGNGNGEQCPSGSVYGKAKAATPILGEALEGPVFLRSSDHQLPDLVIALSNSQVDFDLVGRVDSVKGGGLRNTFEASPDAPVSSFDLEMAGGAKGLFVNSRDLCAKTYRAKAIFTGQNGKVHRFSPPLKAKCPKKRSKRHARHGRRAGY